MKYCNHPWLYWNENGEYCLICKEEKKVDDGIEVELIRFFRWYPEGRKRGHELKIPLD